MICRICEAKISEEILMVKEMMFGTEKYYPYLKCSDCGCVQIKEPEKNSENLYPSNYYSFNTYNNSGIIFKIKRYIVRHSVANALGDHLIGSAFFARKERDGGAHALKNKISKNSKILDVGCGDGSLIDALNWCDFKDLTGIDPFLDKDVLKYNYQLLKKSIETLEGNNRFDIIMLHHSFEHVDNPFEVMFHIKRLLKTDGLCIIRIPVSDSYAFNSYKENWVQLDAPRHNFLHTNKSMELITSKNDLTIESIVDDSLEFQFIGSEQYKNDIPLNHSRSYYISPFKKTFFNRKHLFSIKEINAFKRRAIELNSQGAGDQRIYYIRNKK